MKKTTTKETFIKFVNSSVMKPNNFQSLDDFICHCNICAIVYYDFLDIELTKYLCEKKWVDFFKNQKLLVSCTQTK
jgi:hypothetical protein